MTILDYFLHGLQNNLHLRKEWVVSLFAVTELPKNPNELKYDYQLLNIDGNYSYIDPTTNELFVFDSAPVTEPLLSHKTTVDIKSGDLPNVSSDLTTTIGNLLFNALVLVYPFKDKIPYINKQASIRAIEKIISNRLIDDPDTSDVPTNIDIGMQNLLDSTTEPTGVNTDPTTSPITVSEYKTFAEAALALAGYATLFVPAATKRTLVPAPGYEELKKQLFAKYKDRLNDATVIAEIEQQLFLLDDKWIKEDPDFGFVRSNKTMRVARKKMFYMQGIETGFAEDGDFTLIPTSLNEGWDITKLPAMVNSLRDGSFNRGAQTALGGEKTKTIFRVMTGAVIDTEDCGSKLGITKIVSKDTSNVYLGSTAILPDGSQTVINEATMTPYLGQSILIRSPLYCLSGHNNYCAKCVGEFIRGHENSLGVIAAACGSQLLLLFMKKMHGTILSTVKYDVFKELK
jgi:hypothetical protein